MTTEREMLDFAAKACELTVHGLADKFVVQHNYGSNGLCVANNRGGDSLWNPLTNSADCAAMCAKLEIDTTWFPTHMVCEIVTKDDKHLWHVSEFEDYDNPEAAWRYAATMVGALIGGYKK